MTTGYKIANKIVSLLSELSPRIWCRGTRCRVYLRYPRPYCGGAGGGELGFVELSGVKPSFRGLAAPIDLLIKIKAAVEAADKT